MKIKLPILLLLSVFTYSASKAQDSLLRKVNHNTTFVHFWIVGVNDANFPKLNQKSSSEDSVIYGKRIVKWIDNNKLKYLSIEDSPASYNTINFIDFKKFNTEQRAIFKEVSRQFQPILKFQKEILMRKEKELLGKKVKANEVNATQVYLLSEAEIVIWKKRLGI